MGSREQDIMLTPARAAHLTRDRFGATCAMVQAHRSGRPRRSPRGRAWTV